MFSCSSDTVLLLAVVAAGSAVRPTRRNPRMESSHESPHLQLVQQPASRRIAFAARGSEGSGVRARARRLHQARTGLAGPRPVAAVGTAARRGDRPRARTARSARTRAAPL